MPDMSHEQSQLNVAFVDWLEIVKCLQLLTAPDHPFAGQSGVASFFLCESPLRPGTISLRRAKVHAALAISASADLLEKEVGVMAKGALKP